MWIGLGCPLLLGLAGAVGGSGGVGLVRRGGRALCSRVVTGLIGGGIAGVGVEGEIFQSPEQLRLPS